MRRVATTTTTAAAADPKKAHKSKQIKTRITTGYHASPAQKYTIPPASKEKENTDRRERDSRKKRERGREVRGEATINAAVAGQEIYKC